jgi:glycosyltransferase involved in cell wall biosynthesis
MIGKEGSSPTVIHIIDFSNRNTWLENQFEFFSKSGISQALVSYAQSGEITEFLSSKGFQKIKAVKPGVLNFLRSILLIKGWAISNQTVIFAHGHWPSIYAYLLKKIVKIEFIVIHHQQPNFFKFYKRTKKITSLIHTKLATLYCCHAKYVQSFSPEVTQKLKEVGIPCSNLLEIPFGIPFPNYVSVPKDQSRIDSEVIQIVSIGRLVWEKRIELGIRTVHELIQDGYQIDYKVVGIGPDLQRLQLLAKDLGISESVQFMGWRTDVSNILSSADFFFHLALTESYGQVLMEARLTEIPIYTSRCGVALEFLENLDSSVGFFDSEDSTEIANSFKNFISGAFGNQTVIDHKLTKALYARHEHTSVMKELLKVLQVYFKLPGNQHL